MFRLFKSDKKYPPFAALNSYAYKGSYFVRCAPWLWVGNYATAFAIKDDKPTMITMDPWPQSIFLAANGQMTVSEYVYFTASQYSGDIPELLDAIIVQELDKLIGLKIVELSLIQTDPKPEHDKPGK